MTDGFWTMVGVVLPVLIVQIFQYLATMKNAKNTEAAREEIKAQVCEVSAKVDENTQLTHQATVSLKHAELMAVGAERDGYVSGIKEGKKQATGPAPLEG